MLAMTTRTMLTLTASGSWAWPLEDLQNIDAMQAFRQSSSEDNDPQSTISPIISLQHKDGDRKPAPATSLAGDIGCHDVSTETTNDLDVMNDDDDGSFNAINDNT